MRELMRELKPEERMRESPARELARMPEQENVQVWMH